MKILLRKSHVIKISTIENSNQEKLPPAKIATKKSLAFENPTQEIYVFKNSTQGNFTFRKLNPRKLSLSKISAMEKLLPSKIPH